MTAVLYLYTHRLVLSWLWSHVQEHTTASQEMAWRWRWEDELYIKRQAKSNMGCLSSTQETWGLVFAFPLSILRMLVFSLYIYTFYLPCYPLAGYVIIKEWQVCLRLLARIFLITLVPFGAQFQQVLYLYNNLASVVSYVFLLSIITLYRWGIRDPESSGDLLKATPWGKWDCNPRLSNSIDLGHGLKFCTCAPRCCACNSWTTLGIAR